jgi:hypothetical protein
MHRHANGVVSCFALEGLAWWLDGRRSGVRPWAPPTDVTKTNPRAPTDERSVLSPVQPEPLFPDTLPLRDTVTRLFDCDWQQVTRRTSSVPVGATGAGKYRLYLDLGGS